MAGGPRRDRPGRGHAGGGGAAGAAAPGAVGVDAEVCTPALDARASSHLAGAAEEGGVGVAVAVALVTVQEQRDAVWAALWACGYDRYDVVELLAETALEDVAIGWTVRDAVRAAERRYGVKPRGTWCPNCRSGDTECCYEAGVCSACGTELEVA